MICNEEPFWYLLKHNERAKIVERVSGRYENLSIDMEVLWATKRTPFNQIKCTLHGAYYGNEVMNSIVYGQFCITVHVGPAGRRSTVKQA